MINRGILYALAFSFLLFSCESEVTTDEPQVEITTEVDSTEFFENAIIANSKTPAPYIDRAGWHLRNGRIKEGLNDLDMALDADSTYGPAWSAKSDVLYLIKEYEACIEHLDVCLDYAPDHIPCMLRRAEMYTHLDQFEKAFELLNDVLRIDEHIHEAYWMKGQIFIEMGDVDNALSSYHTSVEVNPSFFDGYIKLGITNAALGNEIAEDFYKAAISLRPNSVEAKYNLAMYYQDNSNLDRALGLYEEILALDSSNASAAFNSGYIYLEYKQDYKMGEHWFTEAIIRLPYYHQAFYNRGLCRESVDNLEGALSDYDEALKLNPTFDAAAIAKGRVLNSL